MRNAGLSCVTTAKSSPIKAPKANTSSSRSITTEEPSSWWATLTQLLFQPFGFADVLGRPGMGYKVNYVLVRCLTITHQSNFLLNLNKVMPKHATIFFKNINILDPFFGLRWLPVTSLASCSTQSRDGNRARWIANMSQILDLKKKNGLLSWLVHHSICSCCQRVNLIR